MTIKVLVVTATNGEGTISEQAPWLEAYEFPEAYAIPGVDGSVRVSTDGLAVVSTGIGKTAAAATVSAIYASDLDLSKTYVLSTGIAGGPPGPATPGAVFLADAIVDWDLKYRFDNGGERPIGVLDFRPTDYVYYPNAALVEAASRIANDVDLADSPAARRYRESYAVNQASFVGTGPSVCGDEFWHGSRLAGDVDWLLDAYGVDSYRTTESEDAGTASVLARVNQLDRYLSIRGISNFDRPAPGQSAQESLASFRDVIPLAIENSYRVASAIAAEILADWDLWRDGPPG